MAENTTKKIEVLLTVLLLLFLTNCANQLPPGGGEIDTIPPEIISVRPDDGTINYSDKIVRVSFSEYVDKRSFREAIFISPAIDGELEISWTGKTATVTFPQSLRNDFTYVVTIGTDVVDLNNRNRMAKSVTISFSTGDQIDRRSISGRVYDKDADGVLIFAYRVSDDTTDYLKHKPDYISQVGIGGNFTLNGLAEDKYRVFAVKDQLRDLLFQSETDRIGMPFSDIELIGGDSTFSGLDFFLMSADTIKPRLISAVMTDERHILVTTSKPVDSLIFNPSNFSIIDSTDNVELGVLYAFKGNTKPEEFVVVTDINLPYDNSLFFRADRLLDKSGNLYTDDYASLTVSERPDTSAVRIFKTFPADLTKLDFKGPVIRFYFDDAFNSDEAAGAVSFTDTMGVRIPYNIFFPDDATIELKPSANLSTDKDYLVSIDLSRIKDASGNFNDTTIIYKITTISGLEFTGASGKVAAEDFNDLILVLESTDSKDTYYKNKVNSQSEFSFERIDQGKYLLWGFYDVNQNDKYDHGYPSPLVYSERFFVSKDTLELRPRWNITDILFEIK